MRYQPPQDTDYKRLGLTVFLAAVTLIVWQNYIDHPRRVKMAEYVKAQEAKQAEKRVESVKALPVNKETPAEENASLNRNERLALSPRVTIANSKIDGTIALKGARFDDLRLAKYRTDLDPHSPEVTLFAPNGDRDAYFTQIGWVAADGKTKVPDHTSQWASDKKSLTPGSPITLSWNNGEGVTFQLVVSLDDDYMFNIEQKVENKSAGDIQVAPYAYINRAYDEPKQHMNIAHEGPIGVVDGVLNEIGYKELREKGSKSFDNASGWLSISDKYWLAALIPGEGGYKANFSHYLKGDRDRYQADYLGSAKTLGSGESTSTGVRLFAGAKEIHALDRYTLGTNGQAPIPLFDRAVDFGSLYFLTKPMFLMLTFFYAHIGNFGIAIMLLTIVVKLALYPLANKSFHSMAQMREVQPQILKIRERYADDQLAMNKEMMALYKREKINPASGCLPVLIQMPVFFALYKVFNVTIEMRHAPFFGWLKDLSATDPSNVFTLFGALPVDAPQWLPHIGILPILFCATMVIQMKMQPKPADPTQAKMMAWMPYIFLYMFAGFASGLVLYWVWSNVLSIIQQQIITRTHHAKMAKKAKVVS